MALQVMQGDENETVRADKGVQQEEEEEQEEVQVAIVGGGLAGLALLLALHTRGIQAHLFEKYSDLRSDTAAAIGIGPNGVTALEGIEPGLSKIISEFGTFTSTLRVDVAINANEVSSTSVTWPPASFMTVNWKSVQQALAKRVCHDYIHCSHELLFYKLMEDGHVHVYFEVKDEKDSNPLQRFKIVRTQLLIGADGIWSAVRKQMINDEPRYLHMVDWNAVVYDPHQELIKGVERGEIYQYVDHVNPSITFALVNAGDYTLWVLRKVDESGELGKSLLRKQGSLGDPRSKVRALQEIPGCEGYNAIRKAIEVTDERSIFERKNMDRLPLAKWSDADCHVLLIGDAAHAQYVGPGQGARTAFEDAHQLALLLEDAKHTGFTKEDIQAAVHKFEELRIPRMRKMQEYAAQSTQLARFQPDWVQKLSQEEVRKRRLEYQNWIEGYPKNQQGDPDSTYCK